MQLIEAALSSGKMDFQNSQLYLQGGEVYGQFE